MRKDIWDRFLLREYYEKEILNNNKFDIPFEMLLDDELDLIYNSFGFKVFRFIYKISLYLNKISLKLKQ